MKRFSTLTLSLALLMGSAATTAQAQILVPKVSTPDVTYTYQIRNAGSNNAYYANNKVGTSNAVQFSLSTVQTPLQVKLEESSTSGKYYLVATNLGDDVTTTYIGCTGTSNSSTVTYYDASGRQNAEWAIKLNTNASAKGYYPLYNLTFESGSSSWNLYTGVNASGSKTMALWNNTDQGSIWNFIPADITTLKALAEDIKSDVDQATTTASKTDVTTAITNAEAVTDENNVLSLSEALLDAYGKFLLAKATVDEPIVSTSTELEDGAAYTITSVSMGGKKCYMNYTDGTGYDVVSTEATDKTNYPKTAKLICRKVGTGQYVFANNAGKYFIFRGTTKTSGADGSNSNKGYLDSYDKECIMTLKADTRSIAYTSTLKSSSTYVYAQFANHNNRVFVINYGPNGTTTPCYDQANGSFYTTQYSSALLIEKASYPNTATFNDATGIDNVEKIATFSAPFPTVIPTDVKAYYISGTNDEKTSATVSRVDGAAIPANTGVLLTAASTTSSATMLPATDETIASVTNNILGNTAGESKTLAESDNAYILTKSGDEVAFYKGKVGTVLAMNKAYLPLSSESSAISMNFNGTPTSITTIKSHAVVSTPIFDLTGRRVQKTVKGSLYIQGGKKIIAQ